MEILKHNKQDLRRFLELVGEGCDLEIYDEPMIYEGIMGYQANIGDKDIFISAKLFEGLNEHNCLEKVLEV